MRQGRRALAGTSAHRLPESVMENNELQKAFNNQEKLLMFTLVQTLLAKEKAAFLESLETIYKDLENIKKAIMEDEE
jgi:hypothetical protein